MYSYEWDAETGGLLLNTTPLNFSKEPRPVYYKELDLLGFDQYWNYDKDDTYPFMWAEANNYWYRGKHVAKTKGGATYERPEVLLLEDPEPDGQRLKSIDVQRMVEKNADLLSVLEQETIKKVYKVFCDYREKVDVFYVAFSGGKDSIVALDIVQKALPHNAFKVLFGDTEMEFPDTYDVIKEVRDWCASTNISFFSSKAKINPLISWNMFGPPSQSIRWCCSVHKTAPQILKLREITNKKSFKGMAFTGVRGDESASRSEYTEISLGEKVKGQYSCHPILEWNSAEVFLHIFKNNLLLNHTYKTGNSRAGCLVCPLATTKNNYFKQVCYGKEEGNLGTNAFNEIILKTTAKELGSDEAIFEFMNTAGWKARKSGKELSIAKAYCIEDDNRETVHITAVQKKTNWKEWIKTLGDVAYIGDDELQITFEDVQHSVRYKENNDTVEFTVQLSNHSKNEILFISALKIVARKSAYCVNCGVCEANCPYGMISFNDSGDVRISNECVKCRKCHDIFHGCLIANSMRLPKGERKMGSIDRYGNMGIEYDWVRQYMELKDEFWNSPHSLGTNMVKNLKSFLNDSEITKKNKFTQFGEVVEKIGIDDEKAWALMLCNLAYTSEFNWWIKNIYVGDVVTSEQIVEMLGDDMSKNSRNHIASAYRNIFISIKQLGNDVGLGICDYEIKNGKRKLHSITRSTWNNYSPEVILYSLYKFAEACGDYYQFTLTRLIDYDIDSDGISPLQIFGLDRETMEKILNGLSINYPDYIQASFTLDLDNITLRSDKTSEDVLKLF